MTRAMATVSGLFLACLLGGCDKPSTTVVVENHYAAPLVVARAKWHAVSFEAPIPPGASSDPEDGVPASPTPAYVLLARTSDPSAGPSGLVVLRSRVGLELHWDSMLRIVVDDDTFAGNCATGSVLTQAEVDLVAERVFADELSGLHYDAATCTTTRR